MFWVKVGAAVIGGFLAGSIVTGLMGFDAATSKILDGCRKTNMYAIDSRNHIIDVYDCSEMQ